MLSIGAASLFGSPAGHAQGVAPTVEISPASETPVIDGILDDPAWKTAARINSFSQVLPRAGAPAGEPTEVLITYDSRHLYIAVRCMDSNPGGILASQLERDADLKSDDSVRIVIDPYGRRQDGYYFEVNPAGARADGLIEHNNDPSLEWDAIWDARTSIDAGGWSLEIAIPTTSLAFDPARSSWGFNVERMIRRNHEKVRWSGHASARDVNHLPSSGFIEGLSGMHQGRGLEFRPYVSVRNTSSSSMPSEEGSDLHAGFDLVWRATPSLTATFTTFTDFAETDVDEREVNLGRFPLFFPEKRDFFLQDEPLFAFGNIDYNPRPFFSRRIGLTPQGQPVDILAGIKLTGRLGPVTVGLLDAQVDSFEGVGSKNLFAGRVAFQITEQLSAGILGTHGEPRANGDNSALGADLNYLAELGGDRSLEVHSWIVGTDSDLGGGSDVAMAVQVLYPNEPVDLELFAGRYGDKYDPGLGFASRTGIQVLSGSGSMRWRNPSPGTRKVDAGAGFEFITDLHGRIEDEEHELFVSWENPANDEVGAEVEFGRERLDVPFEIRPGNVIPAGDHRTTRISMELESSRARRFSGAISAGLGGFYHGSRNDFEAEIEWRPSRHAHLGASYEIRDIQLPGGDFRVHLATLRLALLFSTRLSINTLAQYDNDSDELGVNVRLKWTVGPGKEVFLVLNEGYDTGDSRFVRRQGDATAKAAWTFIF